MNEVKRRLSNIIIGFDQFMQVLVYAGNYSPDETISGMIGRKVQKGTTNWLEMTICKGLRKLQHRHCIDSIDHAEDIRGESF